MSQIIQYRPCSCLDNISSPSFHLCLFPSILDVPFPVVKTLFPEVLFPGVETLSSRAPSVSVKILLSSAPLVSSQHFGCCHLHPNIFVAVFIASLWCSLSLLQHELPLATTLCRIFVVQFPTLVSLVLLSLTTLPHWERTPLWHGYCLVVQVLAQLSLLLPPGATLINILLVFLFMIVLRSLSFLIPPLKNNTIILLLWYTCPRRAHIGLENSEKFSLTGLVSLSAIPTDT